MIGIWPATTKYRQVATHQGQQQAHIGSCEAARGILMVAFCVLLFEAAAFPLTGVAMSVSAAPAHADCGFRHLCLCSCRAVSYTHLDVYKRHGVGSLHGTHHSVSAEFLVTSLDRHRVTLAPRVPQRWRRTTGAGIHHHSCGGRIHLIFDVSWS